MYLILSVESSSQLLCSSSARLVRHPKFPAVKRLTFCDSSARPTTEIGGIAEVCSTRERSNGFAVDFSNNEIYYMIEGNDTNRLSGLVNSSVAIRLGYSSAS